MTKPTQIRKRNGNVVPFDQKYIEEAIAHACDDINQTDRSFIKPLTERVIERIEEGFSGDGVRGIAHVEDVQDAVEKQLMRDGHFDLAKAYILYRAEHKEIRQEQAVKEQEDYDGPMVRQDDGTLVPFDADRINKSIERACMGIEDAVGKVTQIATETKITLYDGITEQELDEATINAALQNVKDDIGFDTIAMRLLLKTAYKSIFKKRTGSELSNVQALHTEYFPKHIERGVRDGLLHENMIKKFDLQRLAEALDTSRDELFVYSGLSTLLHRYALKRDGDHLFETPQYFFMRVAMGLSYVSDDPTVQAITFYNKMSELKYIPGGSTNIGAGTTRSALSNCFLIQIEDDMEHIAKTVSDVMMISKATGGLGVSVSKLRASGSPLAHGGTSTGPTTFAKIMDTAIRAIQRGGKKKGALCFYMENWHLDFPEFIDWRHNAGDDYLRMRTADTASWISDEFMQRVLADEEWYMFDPKETPDLIELYGDAFSERYKEYIVMAEDGKMRAFKKEKAVAIWKRMLASLQGTSHPWITFKDPINLRALNNNTGTIHMSNLCTEICLPQDKDNIAVCNLASLNITAHIDREKNSVHWDELEDTVRTVVRHLDNLIDINELPVAEAAKSDEENRAVGLGVMGIADILEQLGMAYDSEDAYEFIDEVFEFVSYMAIDESANLARERGSYKNFDGSRWAQGWVPIDSLHELKKVRGENLTIDLEHKHEGLDWKGLRKKVKKGMRNATLMAVAPNANIGLVAGTVPGMDVRFAQAFSRNKFSGKYLDINHNLVRELKDLGLWEQVREQILELQGDISTIEAIPQEVRNRYKTSFSTSPYAMIEIAARAQKWIDQAISRNIYLETRDMGEVMDVYQTAWKKGLKTTYYLHMKPRHTAEQSTVKVNKSESVGKTGFAALKKKAATSVATAATTAAAEPVAKKEAPEVVKTANPELIDPALLTQCDSCQ